MYAEVIIDIAHEKLDRTFTYRIPSRMEGILKEGMVVTVPFGNGGLRKGYVVGFSETAEYDAARIKEIISIESSEETTESRLVALAAWMRENYGATMIQALKTVLPIRERVKDKEVKDLVLDAPRDRAEELLHDLKKSRARARARVLEALLLAEDGRISWSSAVKEQGASRAVLLFLEERGVAHLEQRISYRNPVRFHQASRKAAVLSDSQRAAVNRIREEWENKSRPILLHGVTGSGKTQVYMELIRETIEQGQQAIVLIPEIALTYQTVKRFVEQFGDRVSVLNSRLSQGERYDQFRRAKSGEVQIMVGPRSALFTPFENIGLIVIDEEHEPAYKSETTPCYHAREVAVYRAAREGAHVVLGSATPSVDSYYRVSTGEYALVKLEGRFSDRPLPQVDIVDLREELKNGNRSVFCGKLLEEMADRLRKKEQTMLFLNRRGYSGFVSCRSCGHVVKCPHCDVSLSLHNGGRLICHYCGYESKAPNQCPSCESPFIGGFKAGTQQVEQAVRKMFPAARVLRMDFDTTRTKGSYDEILAAFARHEADILIGTQMIVKGHDFPDVTLVGAIAADLSLNDADYRCAERTYQLLCQAVGRSGRGGTPGTAVIQTYHPDHYSIVSAAKQDYEGFYEQELSYRMLLGYPPAASMLAIRGSSEDEEQLTKAMHYLGEFTARLHPDGMPAEKIGPAPERISRVKDVYRQVIHLKHADRQALVRIKNLTEQYIRMNRGFQKIFIQFDFQ